MSERFGQGTLPSVLSRLNLVRGLVEFGRFNEAIDRGEEAIRIAEAANHAASLLLGWLACGLAYLRRGDVAHAIAALEHSVRICREVELPIFLHWSGPALGAAYALAGRVTESVAVLEQVLAQDTSMNVMSQNTLTVAYLGETHLLAGRVQDATQHAERALTLACQRNERGYRAWVLWLLGEIASRHEPPEPSAPQRPTRKPWSGSTNLGMRPLVAHCHLGLGKLYRRTGKAQESQEQLVTATAMYRELEMRFWLEKVEVEMRQLA